MSRAVLDRPKLMSPSTFVPLEREGVLVRTLAPGESVSPITALLHRAYAKQVSMALAPLAGRQDDVVTRRRCASGECFLAELPERRDGPEALVGTILFQEVEAAAPPPFFTHPGVTHFSQFAVDPACQGRGIGRILLEVVEARAGEAGAAELALSMAEPDRDLFAFYVNRGYRLVEHWQWPYTNYRSCIMSKRVG